MTGIIILLVSITAGVLIGELDMVTGLVVLVVGSVAGLIVTWNELS